MSEFEHGEIDADLPPSESDCETASADIAAVEGLKAKIRDLITETHKSLKGWPKPLPEDFMDYVTDGLDDLFHDSLKTARETVEEYEGAEAADYQAQVREQYYFGQMGR